LDGLDGLDGLDLQMFYSPIEHSLLIIHPSNMPPPSLQKKQTPH